MQETDEQLEARLKSEQAKREVLKQQLHQAQTLYEWKIQREKPEETWMALGIVVVCFLVGGLCFWGSGDPFWLWAFIGVGVFIGGMAKFWGGADDYYHYQLTPLGIHYTQEQLVPEFFFKCVRGFALVGIVVCIIAGIELGPLAFAGAGAFALMSFGLTNYQRPEPDEAMFYFAKKYTVFDIKSSENIYLASHPYKLISSGDIFCSLENKKEILKFFEAIMDDYKIVEVERHKELYDHESFPNS